MNLRKLTFATLLMAAAAVAQTPVYQWHTFYNPNPGGWEDGSGKAITTDNAGNIYVVGETFRPETFAPGVPIHNVQAGKRSAVIVKLSPAGSLLWYTFYTGFQGAAALGVATDDNGGVYITGNGDIEADASQQPRNSGGPQAMFVLKLNSNGQFQWHGKYGDGDTGHAIAVDKQNHYVYVTGNKYCCRSWTTPGTAIREHVYGVNDVFVLAIDTDGYYQWHTYHGDGGGLGRAMVLDSEGNIYVGGDQQQAFIFKLNGPSAGTGRGTLAWNRFWGSGRVHGLAFDPASNMIYAAGGCWPSWTGPAGQAPIHNYTVWAWGIFVLKIDTNGNYQRHSFFANNLGQQADGIVLDGTGMLYITGKDPHNGGHSGFDADSLHANNYYGHYLAALNTNLEYQWHTTYGAYWDTTHGIAMDSSRNLYTVGGSGEPWNGDSNTPPLSAQSGGDSLFVQKFLLTAPRPARLSITRTLSRVDSQIRVQVSVTNTGGTTATNVRLTTGKINTTAGTPLPQTLGNITAGATTTSTLSFPASVGNAGAAAALTLAGTYTGGSFTTAGRITLP